VAVDFLHLAGTAFLELPQLAVILTDIDYRVAYWNKGAELLFEVRSDQAVDRLLDQLITFPDIGHGLRPSLPPAESLLPVKGDKVLVVETNCIPLKDDHFDTSGFLIVIQDITARRRSEQARDAAEETSRTKDKFMAMVAHELRTPLYAILNWTQLFRTGALTGADLPAAFDSIENNASSLSKLMEDLLDISRTIAGKLRLDIGPVRLALIIDRAIDSLRAESDTKHIRIKKSLDDSVGEVAGDLDRLQQVVLNLLSNAIKFTPDDGCVEVWLEGAGRKARLTVSDTGPGISEEFLHSIFDPFSQADARSSKRRGGLGLGLAIVRHLVELHEGTIDVASREGHGASFTVELPLWKVMLTHNDQTNGRNQFRRPDLPLAGLRVIVVDDSRDLLEMLDVALTQYGAAVKLATTTSEAIDALKHWKPDVLVSDIELQGEDGYRLISEVRGMEARQGGRTPAIALSGYTLAEYQERAISAGYQMFISKPVELSQLEAAIALVTGRAG
jgi:signal transduction histidine kinase